MDLELRRVGLQSCFVALPSSVLEILLAGSRVPSFPVVIELRPIKHSIRTTPCFVAWDGAASSSSSIEVPETLAECISLQTGARVRIRARSDVATAETVVVEPATEDDWEILELNAEYLENHILSKVGIVTEGQKFPVWVTGKVVLILRVISTTPKGTVKLVPGVELVVAPKKRQLNRVPSAATETNGPPSEELSIAAIREAWLRIQELDPTFVQPLDLVGVTCSTTPSTAIFISPNTAEAVSFEDGQLVVLSSGQDQNHLQRVGSKGRFNDREAGVQRWSHNTRASSLGDEDGSEPDEEIQHRQAVVRLKYREGVAAGHVMVSFPLRVFIGATIHMSIRLQDVSQKIVVQPMALILSPVLLRPIKEADPSSAGRSDDMDTSIHARTPEQERDTNHVKEGPGGRWQGHQYVVAAATGSQKERTDDTHVSSLLTAWLEAQVTLAGESTFEHATDGVPLASETIVHIRIGSLSEEENLEDRKLSHKFAKCSCMPEVFVKKVGRNRGRVKNFMFLLRASNDSKGGSLHGMRQGLESKQVSDSTGVSPRFFLLQTELLSLPSRLATEQQDTVTGLVITIQQGQPCLLSCITGMDVEVIEGPALKSLTWLEGPAAESLARLEILLCPTLRNNLRLLGTPLPGFVLLHGPTGALEML